MASDLMSAVQEIREHADRYRLAADYYNGEVGEMFSSPAVQRALRKSAGGFGVNLARRPVDARLDRIRITAIAVPEQKSVTQQLVDEVWTANRMDRNSKTVHWAALTYGDAYLIVWPGDDDHDGDEDGAKVDLFYNSPVTTRMFYDTENPHVKKYAAKMWQVGTGDQEQTRVNLYYADRIERYVTSPGHPGGEDADFLQYTDDDAVEWPIPNPFGEVPVFHFRTGDPYGRPEHEGAFGPQNSVTKLSNTLMATIDFSAFPQRYALLDDSSQLIDWHDDPDDLEFQGDVVPSRRRSTLHSEPGSLWQLPGTASVGQFDPANVDAFLKPISAYVRMMAAATATPLRFFDPQGQIPSGEALRADEAPLAASITDIEDWLEETWSDTLVFAALIAGIPAESVDVKWAPVQVVDDLTGWQTVAQKVTTGVPVRNALTEAGYPSDLVDEWMGASVEANLESRVDSLVKIGQAMQFLGSAVQLGALSADTVTEIITSVIGDLLPEVKVEAGEEPQPAPDPLAIAAAAAQGGPPVAKPPADAPQAA